MQPVSLEELLEGAVSFERGDGWITPWRLPFALLKAFPPDDGIPMRAEDAAGVRLCFVTDSPRLELDVLPVRQPRKFDLTANGQLMRTVTLEPGESVVAFDDDLATDGAALEIWLPNTHPVGLRELRVVEGTRLERVDDDRPKWITYGSSISQCGAAHSPARTWPAIVARDRGLNLTCLGYSGQCHIDPMVGRVIRDLEADLITLKLGINVQGGATLSGRTLRPAVIGMVQTIRDRHPDTPIAIVSPIISPPRENQPNAVGMSLGILRAQLQDAVERLEDLGDDHIYYYDGCEVFGEDYVSYLPDLLHPSAEGYEILGQRFSQVVMGSAPFARVLGARQA